MQKYFLYKTTGSMPLYSQVKEILIHDIKTGKYPVNEMIPSETELQEMFGVSRPTIRYAIDSLVSEGYVIKERPKGTRVLAPKIIENLNKITGFTQEMKERNIQYSIEKVEIQKILANDEICSKLEIPLNSTVFLLHRVYYIENEPLASINDYLPLELDLSMDSNIYKDSLYKYLEEKKNIIISQVHEDIQVGYADKSLAEELKMKNSDALLKRTRLSRDQNNRIIEYVVTHYRPDKYMYSVSFSR